MTRVHWCWLHRRNDLVGPGLPDGTFLNVCTFEFGRHLLFASDPVWFHNRIIPCQNIHWRWSAFVESMARSRCTDCTFAFLCDWLWSNLRSWCCFNFLLIIGLRLSDETISLTPDEQNVRSHPCTCVWRLNWGFDSFSVRSSSRTNSLSKYTSITIHFGRVLILAKSMERCRWPWTGLPDGTFVILCVFDFEAVIQIWCSIRP